MLGETIKTLRRHPLLGPTLIGINAGFFLFVYGVYVLISKVIAISRSTLFALASGGAVERSLLLVLLAVLLLGLPLVGYAVARLGVLRSIEAAHGRRLAPWGQLGWRLWSLLKVALMGGLVVTAWLWTLTLVRQELIGNLGLISGTVLLGFFYLCVQALALVNPKEKPIRASLDIMPLLLRSSWPLLASSVGVWLILVGGFYLGGSIWAGSFSKVVYVTTKEWARYVFLFRATLILAGLGVVSFAQVYYERLRPDLHKKVGSQK